MGAIGQEEDGNRGIRWGRVVALADVMACSRFPNMLCRLFQVFRQKWAS
ncbi:hypothetical protein HMPREF9004_1453 [Schaalia cardiffensis F0333]|uniref:Uncharacterized protein n=1 Tax=Schaalia cardiffensis F0333 TaxID=888050 RepID=N6X8R5_9ACTO|nr:hypothetical protein HMPREF9004_1453 [Schaalia cardiffensis F0333]